MKLTPEQIKIIQNFIQKEMEFFDGDSPLLNIVTKIAENGKANAKELEEFYNEAIYYDEEDTEVFYGKLYRQLGFLFAAYLKV